MCMWPNLNLKHRTGALHSIFVALDPKEPLVVCKSIMYHCPTCLFPFNLLCCDDPYTLSIYSQIAIKM